MALYTTTDGYHGRKKKFKHSKSNVRRSSQRIKGIKEVFEVYIAFCGTDSDIF